MDLAKEQHINKLDILVGEYKAQIRGRETDIQELTERPALGQACKLCVRNLLTKTGLQGARRVRHAVVSLHHDYSSYTSAG